jgi:hypothetical protein
LIPAKYSYHWALGVVLSLKRKYPRATETMKRVLRLNDRNLAAYLATGDPLFPDLRNLVHFLDNNGRPLDELYTTTQVLSNIRLYWRCKSKERLLERLDKVEKWSIIEEQGSRGGEVRSDSDESSPSFVL